MPIANITYSTVVNQVKNWIKTNCSNISNYAGINSAFKPGYISTGVTLSSPQYTGTYTVSISTSISQASASNVDNDMESFCNLYNITNKLNTNIPADEFYHFIQDMISFICTKCAFTCSQYAQGTRYLIYYPNHTTYSTVFSISSTETKRLAQSNDVKSLMETIISVVNQNLRTIPCQYTWSLSA